MAYDLNAMDVLKEVTLGQTADAMGRSFSIAAKQKLWYLENPNSQSDDEEAKKDDETQKQVLLTDASFTEEWKTSKAMEFMFWETFWRYTTTDAKNIGSVTARAKDEMEVLRLFFFFST